ncbi:Arginase, catabolizes arginine to ornithine and urea [Malassezia pachydermatis]|uniref:Arginase n=1 Tax=Malassezia pachydermatis TaxID=77020 RepID=A0A0M8MY53_9BASI|nr:arginase [Malassezia pachydermatis]KOS16110.1 arginase [Malassezia pachydermatis]
MEFHSHFLKKPSTVMIPFPFSGGQPRKGVEMGPEAIKKAGLQQQLESLGWEYQEDNSISWDQINEMLNGDEAIGKMRNPRSVSKASEVLADAVEKHAKAGHLPLTVGGDHSLGTGTMIGTARAYPNVACIWVDAHADINTPLTTPSGNLHGCPVAFALGLEGAYVEPYKSWLPNPPINDTNRLVYIGLRDIDEGERKILKEHNIKAFSMHHVDKYGIGKVVEMALAHINGNTSRRDRPIHLSFDVDAMDPSVAPSTGTPVRGGLTFREGHYICEAIAETGALVAMDMVEVNPSLESHAAEQTIAVGCSLIRAALGETLL